MSNNLRGRFFMKMFTLRKVTFSRISNIVYIVKSSTFLIDWLNLLDRIALVAFIIRLKKVYFECFRTCYKFHVFIFVFPSNYVLNRYWTSLFYVFSADEVKSKDKIQLKDKNEVCLLGRWYFSTTAIDGSKSHQKQRANVCFCLDEQHEHVFRIRREENC